MTDGVIKGTGNSRYLKTTADALTKYPTHESLMQAWAAGTLTTDLNGINSAGWSTTGTPLNKSSLLTDALCTSLGISTTSTPTQAMDKLRTLVGEKSQVATGSYVGTGTYGASNPNSLTFSFAPKIVCILGFVSTSGMWEELTDSTGNRAFLFTDVITTSYTRYRGFLYNGSSDWGNSYCKKNSTGKTISWYNAASSPSAAAQRQCNYSGDTFYWLAIG